jgi:PAS domain S-box-containing protein
MPIHAGAMFRGWRVGLTAAAIVLVAVAGLLAVREFAAAERARDLRAWQTRLSIIADSRADAVARWVEAQYDALDDISDNLSVQLYMTELSATPAAARSPEALAQAAYLENLQKAVAARAGFTGPEIGPQVDANVRRVGVAGIALLDRDGAVVAATPAMPPLAGRLAQFLADAPAAARAMLDLHVNEAGRVAVAFSLPVYAVQGDRVPDQLVGRVIGVREVAASLYPLLRQPGIPWASAEAILVRPKDAAVEYISPLADGAAALSRTLARDTPELEAGYAIAHPNGFAQAVDYRNARVLATSRPIAGTPWTLVYKIDRAEALADDETRVTRLTIALLLALALVTAALAAVWRHGASRRSERAAAALKALAERYDSQRALLQLVTDNQPNAITIVDRDGRYRFANKVAAAQAGVAPGDMLGKSVAAVLGPAAAERGAALDKAALAENRIQRDVVRSGANGATRVVQANRVPVPGPDGAADGVLVVEEDITAAVTERERRERTLRDLVSSLVQLVDRRDPYAGDHSNRVARVARAIAEEMGTDTVTADTVETAGKLMNLGKILIPPELLTRPGRLSDDELRQVHESLDHAADFLSGIEFDGPVVETLRQLRERWDGGGAPQGLAGEAIVLSARIVAVANAFVAMVSPRAFRAGLGFDAASERLLAECGRAFDRRVVTALLNHLDNRGGRAEWARFQDSPAAEARPGA